MSALRIIFISSTVGLLMGHILTKTAKPEAQVIEVTPKDDYGHKRSKSKSRPQAHVISLPPVSNRVVEDVQPDQLTEEQEIPEQPTEEVAEESVQGSREYVIDEVVHMGDMAIEKFESGDLERGPLCDEMAKVGRMIYWRNRNIEWIYASEGQDYLENIAPLVDEQCVGSELLDDQKTLFDEYLTNLIKRYEGEE